MKCKICGNESNNKAYKVQELMFGIKGEFDYFQCSQCGCLQIVNIPANMEAYYPDKYYSFTTEPVNYKVNPLSKWMKQTRDHYAIFNKGLLGGILYKLSPNQTLRCLSKIPVSKKSRILDVGCGSGNFLHTLRELGFKNLSGIDPYLQDNIVYKNGLVIEKKSISEKTGKWDVIMFHHSFEHVPDQLETLQHVTRLLDDNGVCLIRIPIASSYAWDHYKEMWVQLDAPRHFFLHSATSLGLLAGKVGMAVTETVYDSDELQFVGSEQYRKGIPLRSENSYVVNPSRALFTEGDIKKFRERAKELNAQRQGDQAAFYLEKKQK